MSATEGLALWDQIEQERITYGMMRYSVYCTVNKLGSQVSSDGSEIGDDIRTAEKEKSDCSKRQVSQYLVQLKALEKRWQSAKARSGRWDFSPDPQYAGDPRYAVFTFPWDGIPSSILKQGCSALNRTPPPAVGIGAEIEQMRQSLSRGKLLSYCLGWSQD
jgi:hypothetical protein